MAIERKLARHELAHRTPKRVGQESRSAMNPPPWKGVNSTGLILLIFFLIAMLFPAQGAPKPPPTAETVLLLYDATGQYGWIGELHAKLLANLLGHFPRLYQITPVENYHSGDIDKYEAAFYLGSIYANPL